jgi:fucose permease
MVAVLRDPLALGVSALVVLYVAVEVAIYVWMPTFLLGYSGSFVWLPGYALTMFFVLRAAGRFLGAWLLARVAWTATLALVGLAILLCFVGALTLGVEIAAWLLPLSGLFMSIVYPTLNSKGISCFPKSQHGAAAGVILFFTAAAAALGPLAMAAVSDAYDSARAGFVLATVFASLLFAGLLGNWIFDPARRRLQASDRNEYGDAPARHPGGEWTLSGPPAPADSAR